MSQSGIYSEVLESCMDESIELNGGVIIIYNDPLLSYILLFNYPSNCYFHVTNFKKKVIYN